MSQNIVSEFCVNQAAIARSRCGVDKSLKDVDSELADFFTLCQKKLGKATSLYRQKTNNNIQAPFTLPDSSWSGMPYINPDRIGQVYTSYHIYKHSNSGAVPCINQYRMGEMLTLYQISIGAPHLVLNHYG